MMLKVDYEHVSRELLRTLRGRRSQAAFSRRLGYRSNVCYLWESGRNQPTAAVALQAASRSGRDLDGALSMFLRSAPAFLQGQDLASREGVVAFLANLRGTMGLGQLAERCGRSRFAVARWLKGSAEPRLPDFLRLIEAASLRLLDFLSELVDLTKLPSLTKPWQQLEAARRLLSGTPWASAVLLLLETEPYRALSKHKAGWIAQRLGISESIEEECLRLLAESGQIQLRKGTWHVAEMQSIDLRSEPDAGRRLKAWWARLGLERIEKGGDGLFSYNVFAVSQADYERLCDMQRAYYRALRAAIASSSPAERVVATNIAMFPLDRTV